MNKKTILVTGANGFIGQALCPMLVESGYNVRVALRKNKQLQNSNYEVFEVGEIDNQTQWEFALSKVDTIIHLAARVHVMKDTSENSLEEFRKTNTKGTLHLAQKAAQYGVRRFIFLSTVKVNGEMTPQKKNGTIECFTEEQESNPEDDYALSKWEAEQALQKVKDESKLDIVILRSPLVYGPNAKANFLNLLKLIKSGIPLPLANIQNKRSLIYKGNLTDIIVRCIDSPNVANNTYLVSDGKDVSTPTLIKTIAQAMNRKPIIIPFPVWALKLLGKFTGKSAYIDRLSDSLCIGNNKIVDALSWKPPCTFEMGIKQTVNYFLSH